MLEISASDTSNMKSRKRLLWIARICLVVATLGVLIASYVFYAHYYYPFSFTDQQTGQALLYGGILLGITVFTWLCPIPGGIIAVLYSVIKLIPRFSLEPLTLIPVPVYAARSGP